MNSTTLRSTPSRRPASRVDSGHFERSFETTLQHISRVDPSWREQASAHQQQLTKPPGSLGALESVGADLCAIQRRVPPVLEASRVLVFAADHGLTREHAVGPYPRDVTAQMVLNFVRGGAAINAFSGVVGADLGVVDMGVDADFASLGLPASDVFRARSVARGTKDISRGPAMTSEQLFQALCIGIELAEECAEDGCHAVALGEMGIGNTSIASALTAAMLQRPVAEVTGRGTGADDATLRRKAALIEQAIEVNQADANNGFEVLQKLGGFELAGIAGLSLGLARRQIAIVADGFISTAAVLAATRIHPGVQDYVFCGHQSPEPGHAHLINALGKTPLLDLGLRLGEGTGACLSLSLLKAAARAMSGMATFAEAGVADKPA